MIKLNKKILQRELVICELSFNSAILAVKMNRKRLVVLEEQQIHIYDVSNMKSLHVIDTPPNPKGYFLQLLFLLTNEYA